jgi:ankyrin repeat protein
VKLKGEFFCDVYSEEIIYGTGCSFKNNRVQEENYIVHLIWFPMKTLPDWLLEHGGANLIDLRTGEGWTALMYAAYGGHKRIVAVLLRHRADINIYSRVASHSTAASNLM